MDSPNYCFITLWQVEATCEEIYNTLKDTNELPRWWRAVYLDVAIREKGDANGCNKVVELYTKGWLPYTIRWKIGGIYSALPNTISASSPTKISF
jgi:hypothetical protein